jgi:hypothetical protein
MTKYGVYIIESLRSDDYFDGETLHDILKLSDIPSRYKWVESIEDLKNKLKLFGLSNYRYLHISCHADETGIEINGEELSNKELQELTSKYLKDKRVFLSACKGANLDLASKLIIENGAISVIGTPINLRFDKSTLFWPSFYHAMNEIDNTKMRKEDITNILRKCVDLFEVPINYYNVHVKNKKFLWRLKIRHNETLNNRLILARK